MSKFFNSQNFSRNRARDYLIYFTSSNGTYDIYRYNRDAGTVTPVNRPSELLSAEHIYISYAYLGGIHLCNYSYTKTSNNTQTILRFYIGQVVPESRMAPNLRFYDFPNAVFLWRGDIAPFTRGLEPVIWIDITFTGDTITSTEFRTPNDYTSYDKYITAYGLWSHSGTSELAVAGFKLVNEDTAYSYMYRQWTTLQELGYQGRNNSALRGYSFLSGSFTGDSDLVLSRGVGDPIPIAGFICFSRVNGQPYIHLYLVASSEHSFDIQAEPDQVAYAAWVKCQTVGTNMSFSGWTQQAMDYYQIDI